MLVPMLELLGICGCSREKYRQTVDRDVYRTIAKSSQDPRWAQSAFNIDSDPRSRYHVPENIDCPPMPVDDPASHEFMKRIWGMKGYPHWLDHGVTNDYQNPNWRQRLVDYVPLTEDGKIILNVDTALALAYLHSPDYRTQLEELYLTAVDVSTERFAFETQFFGGVDTEFSHLGNERIGGESNRLTVDSNLDVSQRFATAGTLLVSLANQMTWQFAGPNTNSNLSILGFTLTQPFLRGGGRAVGLERLTRTQRAMLANLRNFQLYRQGFYSGISVGVPGGGVRRPGGGFGGTGLTAFTGSGAGGQGGIAGATGFGFFGSNNSGAAGSAGGGLSGGGAGTVGGMIGLLQRGQQIRNDEYSLSLQQRTLTLLEANLKAGIIDLTQVDNFRQSIQTLRATLAQSRTSYQDDLDRYKRDALGLPPDIELQLDDSFIRQFQLIDTRVVQLQDSLAEFQAEVGELPEAPDVGAVVPYVQQSAALLQRARQLTIAAEHDLQKMQAQVEVRQKTMPAAQQSNLYKDVELLTLEFEKFPERLEELSSRLDGMQKRSGPTDELIDDLVGWHRILGNYIQSVSLAQARARLESIVLEPVDLDVSTAVNVARNYRFDYMNNRASLVDSWRLIEFNANALQSVLNVGLSGDVQTTGDNPLKFQAPTGSLTANLAWDTPLTRVQERNNYRQQLIQYARDRRGLVEFDDNQVAVLRSQLRWLAQLHSNLEIQRGAVVIAIRRVEYTQSRLSAPLPVPRPGAPPPVFGPTAVQNLLQALADLSGAQNNFMSVWLRFYSTRMQLMRTLGVMELDENGAWVDRPVHDVLSELRSASCLDAEDLPPDIPHDYWHLAEPLASGEAISRKLTVGAVNYQPAADYDAMATGE